MLYPVKKMQIISNTDFNSTPCLIWSSKSFLEFGSAALGDLTEFDVSTC